MKKSLLIGLIMILFLGIVLTSTSAYSAGAGMFIEAVEINNTEYSFNIEVNGVSGSITAADVLLNYDKALLSYKSVELIPNGWLKLEEKTDEAGIARYILANNGNQNAITQRTSLLRVSFTRKNNQEIGNILVKATLADAQGNETAAIPASIKDTTVIIKDTTVSGKVELYLGENEQDLQLFNSIKTDVLQTRVNETLALLNFTLKNSITGETSVIKGQDAFIKSGAQQNLGAQTFDGTIESNFTVAVTKTFDKLIISGAGYKSKTFDIIIQIDQDNKVNSNNNIVLKPGDLGKFDINSKSKVFEQDNKINTMDYELWKDIKTNKDTATPEQLVIADFDKNGDLDTTDFELWKLVFINSN